MNGDLSLSQALGGLRIANPDDSPNRSQEVLVTTDDSPATQSNTAAAPNIQGGTIPTAQSDSHSVAPHEPTTQQQQRRQQQTYAVANESAAALLRNAQSNLNTSTQGYAGPSPEPSPGLQRYRSYRAGRTQGSESGVPPSGPGHPGQYYDQQQGGYYGGPRPDHTRTSMYGMRPDPRADERYAPRVPQIEPSRSYHSGRPWQEQQGPIDGSIPARRSSRGVGTGGGGAEGAGYPTIAGIPMAPPTFQDPPFVSNSSEEWKDKGAAVAIKKEVDAEGRTIIRHIKKGVRDFSFGRILGEGSYSTV